MELAAAAALSCKIPRDRILNFMEADELLEWAQQVRSRSKSFS
jgi:hypothetical protein